MDQTELINIVKNEKHWGLTLQVFHYQQDIEKAFDMGLETAIAVLESSIGLSTAAQHQLLKKLKEDRFNNRIKIIIKTKQKPSWQTKNN